MVIVSLLMTNVIFLFNWFTYIFT